MKEIKAKALFRIKEGELEAFKQLIPRFFEAVDGKEPGLLRYNWYLHEAVMECVVLEDYVDSDAVLAHVGHVGDLIQESMKVADLSLELYGNPSPELMKVLEGMGVTPYPFFRGL